MRTIAFLQLHNELENGNLIRCLENCRRWSDDIFIYDDCSTDGSQEIYKKYTNSQNVILGTVRDFAAELYHKQQLLALALKSNPDWIGWIDGDAILCKEITENCKEYLKMLDQIGKDGSYLHNLNLWRHPAFYRTDNKFNGLWHVVFWKNNGHLHYDPVKRLHQPQFPKGMESIHKPSADVPLLHFGFSSERLIIKKYLTYKSYGQTGWMLDRLIDEQTSYVLEKVQKYWYPIENLPVDFDTVSMPKSLTYNAVRALSTWESFKLTKEYKELL